MTDVYNKALCDERQINRSRELDGLKAIDADHADRITKVENAVLILTKLAENDKFSKIVTAALCAVIIVLAFGKEFDSAIIVAFLQ